MYDEISVSWNDIMVIATTEALTHVTRKGLVDPRTGERCALKALMRKTITDALVFTGADEVATVNSIVNKIDFSEFQPSFIKALGEITIGIRDAANELSENLVVNSRI